MSPTATNAFATATRRLEYAAALIKDAAESGEAALVGLAYAEVLYAKGELATALQILELEETVRAAAAERSNVNPPLRIVR